MGTARWGLLGFVAARLLVPSAVSAAPIDLTSGTSGQLAHSQSFNETRASDVTVLDPAGMTVDALRLDGLQNGAACSTRVGARIYDSETTALVASSNAFVGTATSVSLPIDAALLPTRTYRIGFYVETIPRSKGSGTLFLANPPYVEATGHLRVNQGHSIDADGFPTHLNLGQPLTTIDAATGLRSDRSVATAELVLRRRASGSSQLELRSRDGALPFPTVGGPDDPMDGQPGGVTIELFSLREGESRVTVPAGDGTAAWNATAHAYRYRNPEAPDGPTSIRTFVLRAAKRPMLKIVAKTVPLPMAVSQGAVAVRLTMGSTRICARFAGAAIRRDEPGTFIASASVSPVAGCNDIDLRLGSRCGDGVCQLDEECDQCFRDCGPCASPPAPPFLPIALGLAAFAPFIASADCATLPPTLSAPDPAQASCWASPFGSVESADDLIPLLPSRCCAGSVCGGDVAIDEPDQSIFELGTTVNGGSLFLSVLQGCLAADPPITTFLLPTLAHPEDCEFGYGSVQTLVPVVLTKVVPNGPNAGIEVAPYCGPGMCRFGFCAEGATCETCSRECPGSSGS